MTNSQNCTCQQSSENCWDQCVCMIGSMQIMSADMHEFKRGRPLCAAPALSSLCCSNAILCYIDAIDALAVFVRDTSILLLVPRHAKCCFEREYTCCVQDHILTWC